MRSGSKRRVKVSEIEDKMWGTWWSKFWLKNVSVFTDWQVLYSEGSYRIRCPREYNFSRDWILKHGTEIVNILNIFSAIFLSWSSNPKEFNEIVHDTQSENILFSCEYKQPKQIHISYDYSLKIFLQTQWTHILSIQIKKKKQVKLNPPRTI